MSIRVLSRIVLAVFTVVCVSAIGTAALGQSSEGVANTGAMILEHIGMGCTNCHGKEGPKGMMMEHQDMQCSVCHADASAAAKASAKALANTGVPLDSVMILEHKNMNCASCHGTKGPKGMMMEHEGIDCSVCHPTKH